MGCVECKLCHQEEEKNQFEYPPKDQQKNEFSASNTEFNSIQNISETNTYQTPDKNFSNTFEEKIKSIGKIISEEDFQMIISDNINIYKQNDPLPFQRKNFLSHQMKPVEFSGGNIYHGEWNENYEMDGCGKYFLREEKVLCEGIWEKGELKMARIYYPNGEFYEGEMSNSCYNGTGKLINETKDEYVGNFLNGEKSGEGKLIFNDGTIYTGNFMNNTFSGYGEMQWNNGIKYEGYFSKNFLDGMGSMIGEDEQYEGNFEKNLFHGKGKYIYNNGDEYNGDFEYGIRKGKGFYLQKNGLVFEGMWDNNMPNGFGKINLNGKIIKCNYHNGKIIGVPADDDGNNYSNNIDFNFYVENMKLSGKKLPHLENNDLTISRYKAGTELSFLEE